MTTLTFNTQAVVATRSGTGWTMDVTAANLDADTTLKDFVVLFDDVVQPDTLFTKVTPTSVQYTGPSIGSTTVELRRKTPLSPIKTVKYGERFASDDWNREMNRVSRRAAEYEAFGIGSLGDISGVPLNDAYDSVWGTDILYAPTRQAVYNKIESVITNYTANDTALNAQFANYAPLNSPNLTGTPTAPTPPVTSNTTQLQTTAGVRNFLSSTTEAKTIANASANATPAVSTNNTALATTAFAHMASVAKRITTAAAAGPVNVAEGAGYVNLVSATVTPRSANSTFLVFFYAGVQPSGPNGVYQVRLKAGSGTTNILAANRNWSGGGDVELGHMSMMGFFSPGSASALTFSVEALTQVAGNSVIYGPDNTVGVDAANVAGTRAKLIVIEVENTL